MLTEPVTQRLRSRRTVVPVAMVLLTAIASVASAHDTWLLPSSLRVPVGAKVTLHLTSGEAFPTDSFLIDGKRLTKAVARLNGTVAPLGPGTNGDRARLFTWQPKAAGVATLGVELAPKVLVLAPDKIGVYLDDINANAALRARWSAIPSPKQWRESYVKHATSFVRVGAPDRDTSWKVPLGLRLELVPLRDPTSLRVGDTLAVRVLLAGVPMSGLQVGAMAAGETAVKFATSDAVGVARIVLRRAGLWLINGTDLRRVTKPNLEWESDFVTLTVAVTP